MNGFIVVCIGLFAASMISLAYLSGYYHGGYSESNSVIRKLALIQAQKNSENIVEGAVYKFYTVSPFRRIEHIGVVREFKYSDYIEVEDYEHFKFSINTMDLIKAEKLSDEETEKFKQKFNLT